MQWQGEGLIIHALAHGEGHVVLSLFSRSHGLHKGLYSPGARKRGFVQPGNLMDVSWNARLSEHLGQFRGEVTHATASYVITQRHQLAVLQALCSVLRSFLPERDPMPELYDHTAAFLRVLHNDPFPYVAYVEWELELLRMLGFGLDFSCCAATGISQDLAYVSPKSGRAVSAAAGAPYRDKLLPLPTWLASGLSSAADGLPPSRNDVSDGLKLTRYFLAKSLAISAHTSSRSGLPDARETLAELCLKEYSFHHA